MFRLLHPPRRAAAPRRRAAAALTGFTLIAAALAGVAVAGPANAASAEFTPVPSGVPARPAAPATPDPSLTAYPLASATGALDNPDKGLVTYYSAGDNENSSSEYPHSMQWSYFPLSEIMDNPDNCQDYDWTDLDSMLNEVASYGNTAAIRFYLEYPSGDPTDGIPACFTGHVSTRTDSYWDTTSPDYDSPFLLSAVGDFIAALAARYDGDPRIGFIQAGIVGLWGENHTWPYDGLASDGGYPNYMPTNADFAKIVDDFADGFHRTQVEVRYPYTAGGAASGLNIGYHDDSFCALEGSPLEGVTLPESLGGASYAQLQLDLNQGTENKWITDSMGGEVYPSIQSDAFANYPDGSTADDVDNMGDCVNLTHATWMLDQGSQSTASNDPGTDAAVEAMGYNFTANNAYFKSTASGSAEVGVQITNNGVAPFYYPWTMSLGLENSSGQIVQTWNTPWDIRTIMPASIQPYPDWDVAGDPSSIPYGYPQYFQTQVNLSGVPAGSYQWVLEADNPLTADSSAAKPLLFSNATQNSDGWLGLGSVTVAAATAGTAPSAPTNLTATGTASTVGLSWSAPSGGTTPTGYEVLRNGTEIATTQSASYTDPSLPVSSSNTYTVKAFDAAGDTSAASAAVTGSTANGVDTAAPTAPTNVTTSDVTGDSATLSWTQSSDNTGVAGYDVYRNGKLVGTTTFTDYTDIELSGATAYQYTVKAYDPAGNLSAASSPVDITTGASEVTTAPGSPTALTSPSQTGSAVDLSWTAPTSTGIGVAGYDIYRNGTLVGTTTATEQGTAGTPTPTLYTDTGLASGTTYTYTVAAFDAAGDTSAVSSAITATTVALSDVAPSTPTGLASSAQTDSSISLTWTASTANSGGSVAGYDVYRNGTLVGTSTSTSYTDTGLSASTSYAYTVAAYDSAGDTSAQSSAITASTSASTCTDCTPPSTPGGLTADQETSSGIQISWTASTSSDGVAGYDVYRNGTLVGTSTSTSYTDTGLSASTSYTYAVAAYASSSTASAESSSLSVTTTASGVTGYEAESPSNTLAGGAVVASCSACSGGEDVGYIGEGGTLTFSDVNAATAGSYTMDVQYVDGDAGRSAVITVNGTATTVAFTGTDNSNWDTVQTKSVTVSLNAGTNTVEFSNASAYAPDIDQITINSGGGSSSSAAVYEGNASANTLAGGAVAQSCSACLDGDDVGYIGDGGTLTFPDISKTAAGSYALTIYYVDGDAGRSAVITVNGTATTVAFTGTDNSNWDTVQTKSVTVSLNAGNNTIEFSNPSAYAPDIDHLLV